MVGCVAVACKNNSNFKTSNGAENLSFYRFYRLPRDSKLKITCLLWKEGRNKDTSSMFECLYRRERKPAVQVVCLHYVHYTHYTSPRPMW